MLSAEKHSGVRVAARVAGWSELEEHVSACKHQTARQTVTSQAYRDGFNRDVHRPDNPGAPVVMVASLPQNELTSYRGEKITTKCLSGTTHGTLNERCS